MGFKQSTICANVKIKIIRCQQKQGWTLKALYIFIIADTLLITSCDA